MYRHDDCSPPLLPSSSPSSSPPMICFHPAYEHRCNVCHCFEPWHGNGHHYHFCGVACCCYFCQRDFAVWHFYCPWLSLYRQSIDSVHYPFEYYGRHRCHFVCLLQLQNVEFNKRIRYISCMTVVLNCRVVFLYDIYIWDLQQPFSGRSFVTLVSSTLEWLSSFNGMLAVSAYNQLFISD